MKMGGKGYGKRASDKTQKNVDDMRSRLRGALGEARKSPAGQAAQKKKKK